MTNTFSSLYQRARASRDRYDANAEAGLESQFANNPSAPIPGGHAGALNALRQSLGTARAQAAFNPQWDAWLQSMQEAGGGQPVQLAGDIGTSESRGNYGADTSDMGTVRRFGTLAGLHEALKARRRR